MTYQPIEHYGIIGNLRTAALVGSLTPPWLMPVNKLRETR